MLKKNRLPHLIGLILCLEILIYLWAVWTTDPEFIFDKCARNSGRVSSFINLAILLMIGYYGLKKIFREQPMKEKFQALFTLFAVNHFIHFFYVFQNFKSHTLILSPVENFHGMLTFISIPIILLCVWGFNKLNKVLYFAIVLHLFNVSYFIMQTFYSKITPESPAYHNQLGIYVTSAALLYILYRVFRESKPAPETSPMGA
jgi:hypothetical protein